MTKTKKLDELVSSVEDLLAQLPDDLTPELEKLRDEVDAGIFEAWTAIACEGRDEARARTALQSNTLWATVGIAALAGATSLLAFQARRPARLS